MPMFTSPADHTVRLTPVAPSRPRTTRTDRLVLVGLCCLAAVLFAWGISRSQFHPFYADAVRSMTLSWKGFLFGSFDPGNTITLDKLPGFLWPQALSARLFGFHPWALTLPQVVEGVAAVGVLHVLVRRWAGRTAGVLAALGFMLTPVVTGLFRTAVEDPAFTLLLLLAAEATARAARTGRTRTLLLAATWVGLAFQAKMLEAFAVLPPLAAVHLISSPAPLRRRCAQLGVAGALTVLVSASWMVLVAVTPPADRPYVDGTTDNSPVSMVVGYNFLNRFSAVGLNATGTGSVSAVRGGGAAAHPAAPYAAGTASRATTTGPAAASQPPRLSPNAAGPADRNDGWAKLLRGSLATQVGWLYPAALAGLVAGLVSRRGRPRTDPVRAGYLLWGGWLAVFFVVLSAGSVAGHAYYLGVVAAPLAALSGAGVPELWRAYRAATSPSTVSSPSTTPAAGTAPEAPRGPVTRATRLAALAALALPSTVAATAAWAIVLSRPYPGFRPWVTPTVALLGGVCVVLLLLLLLLPLVLRPLNGRPRARLARAMTAATVATGLAAALLAPTVWTSSVFDARFAHSMMGALGPSGQFGFGAGTGPSNGAASNGGRNALPASWSRLLGGGNGGRGSSSLDAGQRALLAYTTAHRGAARYLFATTSWTSAAPFILAAGAPVMPMGGFTEQVPWPTVGVVRQDVATGRLRYVLVGASRMPGFAAGTPGTPGTPERTTVTGGAAIAARGGQRGRAGDGATAASGVSSWVAAACRPVDVPGMQTNRQDPQRLYDCAGDSAAPGPAKTAVAAAAAAAAARSRR